MVSQFPSPVNPRRIRLQTSRRYGILTAVICMRKWPSEQILASVRGFRLPRYGEIPDVGLYLEQVTRYLAACFSPLAESPLTPSMISNYVKRGLIANPVRKQYDRDRIAALIFISLAKTVLSLDDIRLLLRLQRDTYTRQAAYDYFCEALEGALRDVFGVEKPGARHRGGRRRREAAALQYDHRRGPQALSRGLRGGDRRPGTGKPGPPGRRDGAEAPVKKRKKTAPLLRRGSSFPTRGQPPRTPAIWSLYWL